MLAHTILAKKLLFQVWNCPTTAHGHSSQMIPAPVLFFSSESRSCFGCSMIMNPDENPRICDALCFQLNQRNTSCAVWGVARSSLAVLCCPASWKVSLNEDKCRKEPVRSNREEKIQFAVGKWRLEADMLVYCHNIINTRERREL